MIDPSGTRARLAKSALLYTRCSFRDSMIADPDYLAPTNPRAADGRQSKPTIIQKRETHGRDTDPDRHPPARHPARGPGCIATWSDQKLHNALHRDLVLGMRRIPPQNTKDELGPGPPRRGGASQHTRHREAIPRPAPGPRTYGHLWATPTHTRTPAPEGPCVVSSSTCNRKLSGGAGD